jgi:hypothetical protein
MVFIGALSLVCPAAVAAAGPPHSQDDIFESCIERLIDLAEPRRK